MPINVRLLDKNSEGNSHFPEPKTSKFVPFGKGFADCSDEYSNGVD